MRVTVKKWGNSASVRIPSAVMHAANLRLDQTVEVREEKGRVVIERIPEPAYDLEKMLDQITPKNLHEPVDFGKPVGKEIW
ncbi:MAG: PbsX family transcriptional regulator [Proteobacteria bacterium]|jgi:antitoxin MazE|nr:MAG: PbsX family transcriptional regulator [Pseudomonadota bacterium]